MTSSSRFRSSSLSPSKQSKAQLTKLHYAPPLEKQFIMFSYVEKQSGLGVIFHQRLLLFDSLNKTLRYFSKIPDPLPHPQMPLPEGKQMIKIKTIRNFEFKSTRTGIGKVSVKWLDLKNVRKEWNLKFSSNVLMTDWVILVNQAIKQGHLQPQNRPKNPTRQDLNTKNIDKYMTKFILETGGVSSRRNSTVQSQTGGVGKDAPIWLSQEIDKKQKQINQIHSQMHQPTKKTNRQNEASQQIQTNPLQYANLTPHFNEKQSENQMVEREQKQKSGVIKQEIKNGSDKKKEQKLNLHVNDSIKTIKKPLNQFTMKNPPTIIEQNESKFSNNEVELTQSVKNFRLNREPIPEDHGEVQIEDSMYGSIKPSQFSATPTSKYHQTIKIGEQKLQQKVVQKHRHMEQMKKDEKMEVLIKREQQGGQKIQYNMVSSKEQSSAQKLKINERRKQRKSIDQKNKQLFSYDWVSSSYYQPFVYHQFVTVSEQFSAYLVENFDALLKQASARPSPTLFCTQSDLFITKYNIQFQVPLNLNTVSQWECDLKMRQYTSVVGYINRLTKNSLPLSTAALKQKYNISKVIALPYCRVIYKFREIRCKAVLNCDEESQGFKQIVKQERLNLDRFFGIRQKLWTYYYRNGTIVVNYGLDSVQIQSKTDSKILDKILQDLSTRVLSIAHYKDLQMFCQFYYEISLNANKLLQLLKKCIERYQNCPLTSTLASIAYSVKVSSEIRNVVVTKMDKFSSIQLNQAISSLVKSCSQKIDQKILQELERELLAEGIQNKGANVYTSVNSKLDKNKNDRRNLSRQLNLNLNLNVNLESLIDKNCMFNSLVQILGVSVAADCYRLRFVTQAVPIGAAALSPQMENVSQILVDSLLENWQDDKKYWGYEHILLNLNQFQYLWRQSQQQFNLYGRPQPKQSLTTKYGNLYPFILSYISLYSQYTLYPNPISHLHSPCPNYNAQLKQITRTYPPTSISYGIEINCIKWVTKSGISDCLEVVQSMLMESIQNCVKWTGKCNIFLLDFYQLFVAYSETVYSLGRAIQYSRYAIQLLNQLYGENSLQAAQGWFVLGNAIMQDSTMHEQALQSFLKSLQIISMQKQNTLTSSHRFNFLLRLNSTEQPELTIRLKLIILYLAQRSISKCLEECSISLQLSESLSESNYKNQLNIFSALIRCLQINRQESKLEAILDVAAQKFGSLELGDSKQEEIRQKMIKICLAPYLNLKLVEQNRKHYLGKLLRSIRRKYEKRYTKKQYSSYLAEKLSESNQQSILVWFLNILLDIPLFSPYMRVRNTDSTPEIDHIDYSLYENIFSDKAFPATQSRLLVPAMRANEAIAGVVGFAYLEACYSI